MATNTFLGTATSVAQVWKGTVTDTTTGHTYTLPVTDEAGTSTTFSYTAVGGDSTVTILATSIAAAWNASTDYRLAAVTASILAGQLILTADAPGVPFYIGTPGGTGAWTGTGNTTTNSGALDWNTAANWSSGSVPANSDTLYIDDQAATGIAYGLKQTSLDTITLYVKLGFLYSVGSASYALKTGNNWVIYYGQASNTASAGVGPTRFKVNHGSNDFTWYIYASGSAVSADTGRAALQISGGGSSSKLYVIGNARVNFAMANGDTGQATVVAVSGGSSNTYIGSGVTLATLDASAGTVVCNCAVTTLSTTSGATVTMQGSGTITTAGIGGTVYFNSSGTITTLNAYDGATADFSQNPAARTVTTLNHYSGATVSVNSAVPSHMTFTTRNLINGGTLKLSA